MSAIAYLTTRDVLAGLVSNESRVVSPFRSGEGSSERVSWPNRPPWAASLVERVNDLLQDPLAWDDPFPADVKVAARSLHALSSLVTQQTPRPSVVPTRRGGIQFEWHIFDIDLEIEFYSNGTVGAFGFDRRAEEMFELDESRDLTLIAEWTKRLTNRRRDELLGAQASAD